jgi:hypothetical protein
MTATATIQGIKTLTYPPARGEHYLSVNLALVNPAEVWEVSKALGLEPELVQIANRSGTNIEIHALLYHEQTNGDPLCVPELDAKIDLLADRINTDAIRHVYGGQMIA